METRNWKKYAWEFLSIFVAVITAFALNNWNDNRRDNRAEAKILSEILIGLEKDVEDVELNIFGHESGLKACNFWRRVLTDDAENLDTLQQYYFLLTRDFISIQNTSGYETLKSKGFELIKNDSLRTKIIALYEFDYQTLRKLEEEYNEAQFQENYFYEINRFIAPHFDYDSLGNMVSLEMPIQIAPPDRKVLLSYLWKIQINRKFILQSYREVKERILKLRKEIADELNH